MLVIKLIYQTNRFNCLFNLKNFVELFTSNVLFHLKSKPQAFNQKHRKIILENNSGTS